MKKILSEEPLLHPTAEVRDCTLGRYTDIGARTILLERGQLFVSPFDLNVEHEQIERPLKPVIRVATPVFDNGGVKRGVLVLNYLGAALLQKLAQVTVSFPGSVFLLNKDGYFLRGRSHRTAAHP